MYWTVGAVREGDVLDYLRWVRGSSNLMPRLTGPIAKHGPPGAAAKKRRALARWPPKLWFGGLWGGLQHPFVKHEPLKEELSKQTLWEEGLLIHSLGGFGWI